MSGWKLVPENPTQEMGDAAFQTMDIALANVEMGPIEQYEGAYRVMLKASPTPPDGLYRASGGKVERVEADVVEMLRLAHRWFGGADSIDAFEHIAEWFRKETGYLRPGKDVPDALWSEDYDRKRHAAWEVWRVSKSQEAREALRAALIALRGAS